MRDDRALQRNEYHQTVLRERVITSVDRRLVRSTRASEVQNRVIAAVYQLGNDIWLGVSIIIRSTP